MWLWFQSAHGERCKGSLSAKGQLLSGPQLPVCKVGTVTPTLPATLGGTWGSWSQRTFPHTSVLCAFFFFFSDDAEMH